MKLANMKILRGLIQILDGAGSRARKRNRLGFVKPPITTSQQATVGNGIRVA
jgi:hypothetical protein